MVIGVDDALIAGSIGTSLFGSIFGASSSKKAAKKQRAWEEMMDNTKYQRSRADLEKAGYNPMLAVGNGVGGVPNGAMDMSGQIMAQAADNAISSAVSARKSKAEVEQMSIQNAKIAADTAASNSATELNRALAGQAKANTLNTTAQTVKMGADPRYIIGDVLKNSGIGESISSGSKDAWKFIKSKALDLWDNLKSNSASSIKRPPLTLRPPALPDFQLKRR